jgi:uncharacterized protein (TIGR02145 family)
MKKAVILVILTILSINCSTSEEDGVTNTTIIPLNPTNLTGNNPASSQIVLTWTDNSTNEAGFKIERKTAQTNYTLVGNSNADVTTYTDNTVSNNIPYTYRVYAYNNVGNSLTYSNEFTITSIGIPVLTTLPITTISYTSAVSGGNISDNGGANVTTRGIVWDTNPNPTISLSTKTVNGNGNGTFNSNMSSLSPGVTYYVRAYATNSRGVGYGENISFTTTVLYANGNGLTDICGNNYPSVIIGQQEWMKKNLDVCKYRNGDIIPQVQDPTQWVNLTTGAWCYYQNNTTNGTVYGKLYNYYAVVDPRGLAPQGWHIPSDAEWTQLENFLISNNLNYDGTSTGNKIAKSVAATSLWKPSTTVGSIGNNLNLNNASGFTAIPGGQRNPDLGDNGIEENVFFWTSTSASSSFGPSSYYRTLSFSSSALLRSYNWNYLGFSVRCVKD